MAMGYSQPNGKNIFALWFEVSLSLSIAIPRVLCITHIEIHRKTVLKVMSDEVG